MVRPPDSFWAFVEEMSDGCKKCKFCDHRYSYGTSVSRVKYHLSGIRRATAAHSVVQAAARAVIDDPVGKKRKVMANSSNNEVDDSRILTSLQQQQNNEVNDGMADCSVGSALEWMQRHIGEIELNDEGISCGELLDNTTMRIMQHGDATELEGMQMHPQSPTTLQRTEPERQAVDDGLMISDEGNMTREPEQHVVRDGCYKDLKHIAVETRGDAFPAPELVGEEFEKYKNVIWSWLMNDEVSFIGIYGMGGVGKSTLGRHIHNQLLERSDNYCHHVYWVNVSQDFSIYRLQYLIGKRIDLDLSNEDDEMHRAAKLSKVLAGKQKYVLILDDLWNYFDLEEVGIPCKINGCKLILTTRSLDVCRRMGCQGNVIKVEPLSEEEAWSLFTMELGNYDIKVECLAKSVARECDGLPLGIRTMARSMRGVYDVCEWRNALEELEESRVRRRDMEPQVFRILKFSYLHLNDSALQQCFLSCALFPEDFEIERQDLIEFLIAKRIIEGRKSRKAEFDKGHEMLNQLENACLLESVRFESESESAVKMHDLVRDMALQEMRQNSQAMVEAGQQLRELPDEEKWKENLITISLIGNAIKEIPFSHSPRCPNLSTLLLCRNFKLKFVGDPFFKQLHKLEVLDLSHTAIQKLPNSISDLVTLTVLSLGKCSNLTHVPSLAKLKALKKLDLHETAIKEVPPGLALLSSLRFLNLNGTLIQEFPAGILPNLRNLQVLRLFPYHNIMMNSVKAEELALLRKLETIECHFSDLLNFNKYIKSQEWCHQSDAAIKDCDEERQLPTEYKLPIGEMNYSMEEFIKIFYYSEGNFSKSVYLFGSDIKCCSDPLLLPKGTQRLGIEACFDMRSLCDLYLLQHATELKSLSIGDCCSMECLVSFSQISLHVLGMVETLHLHYLDRLHSFCSKGGDAPASLPYNGMFYHLKILRITFCPMLKVLFPPVLVPNLQNLEVIEVEHCLRLETIIATEESDMSSNNDDAIEFCLPKLRILELSNLQSLRSISFGKLICNSLQKVTIFDCKKLKRLPFLCSPLTLKGIYAIPKEWWESVEWDGKNHGYNIWHSLVGDLQNHPLPRSKEIDHLIRGADKLMMLDKVTARRVPFLTILDELVMAMAMEDKVTDRQLMISDEKDGYTEKSFPFKVDIAWQYKPQTSQPKPKPQAQSQPRPMVLPNRPLERNTEKGDDRSLPRPIFAGLDRNKQILSYVFNSLSFDEVVVDSGCKHLCIRDIKCLNSNNWLEDNIINCVADLMSLSEAAKGRRGLVWYMPTYPSAINIDDSFNDFKHVNQLIAGQEKNRGHWKDCEMIVIPINESDLHWYCCVINLKCKKIYYLNSLASDKHISELRIKRCKTLGRYFDRYFRSKNFVAPPENVDFPDVGEFVIESPHVKQQNNGDDCGVHVSWYIRNVSCCSVFSIAFGAEPETIGRHDLAIWLLMNVHNRQREKVITEALNIQAGGAVLN